MKVYNAHSTFWVSSALILFFYITVFVEGPLRPLSLIFISIFLSLYLVCLRSKTIVFYITVIFVGAFYLLSWFLSINAHDPPVILFNFFVLLLTYLFADLLIRNRQLYYIISRVTLYSYLIFIFLFILISMEKGVVFYVYAESIFPNASKNIISFYLIVFSISYIHACYRFDFVPRILPVFITFIYCLLLYGRTGVALSLILLVFCMLSNVFKFKKSYFILFLLGVIGSLSVIYFLFGSLLYQSFSDIISNSKFYKYGLYSPRELMLSEYFEALSIHSLFLGMGDTSIPTSLEFNGNPHNSYIYMNMHYGFLGVITFSISILGLIISILRKKITLFFLLLLLFIKASTDIVFFFGNFTDYILIAILLNIFESPKVTRMSKYD